RKHLQGLLTRLRDERRTRASAICGRRPHLLDHMNDRRANPRVGDPQECPDEPRALLGTMGL
ncbi:MAG TPA: hypothetical protein VGG86_19335, partial [Roseiarcus sp.]